jgi:tRNA threonylcarbamoyladenosine biosynthesis protein TsaB
MLILTVRTDKPEAEVGLYEDMEKITYITWMAHRELATTLHQQIFKLLQSADKEWRDILGIALYKGPGSFTGLRIGAAVANSLANSLEISIVGGGGDNWQDESLKRLMDGDNDRIVIPMYGADAHTTQARR